MYSRLSKVLDNEQSFDQAGFRSGYSTLDHLFVLEQIAEKTQEYQAPVWIAALDFKKAFDTVEHDSLWVALLRQRVNPRYVRILSWLYDGQTGYVQTDCESKRFALERGTEQGDPLSSFIF